VTDGNGWKLVDDGVQRRWHKHVTVTAGFPAAVAWTPVFTTALPVGLVDLGHAHFFWQAYANSWARVLLFGHDSTTATTSIAMNGTVTDGATWAAKGIASVDFDLLLVERLP
jgi:hypothetical protein